jgi:HAD superfamily hydrolase (TIGR01509 family)
MSDYSACVFDLDGTLVDSEPNYFIADRAFLAEYGIDYHDEFRARMVGRGNRELFFHIEREFPDCPLNAMPLERRMALKDQAYLALARSATKAFPEMAKLVAELARRGMPMAVASGSSPEIIDASLECAGLSGFFEVRVSAVEVPKGKPAPDVFLEAARRLGFEPCECLAFEDSRYGVLAAHAAGMACVAAPTIVLAEPDPDISRAELFFPLGQGEGPGRFSAAAALEFMAMPRAFRLTAP